MDNLRESINQLIQNTLTMENQSQNLELESDNTVDYSEKIQEMSQVYCYKNLNTAKSRNFLSNISYSGISKSDFYKQILS